MKQVLSRSMCWKHVHLIRYRLVQRFKASTKDNQKFNENIWSDKYPIPMILDYVFIHFQKLYWWNAFFWEDPSIKTNHWNQVWGLDKNYYRISVEFWKLREFLGEVYLFEVKYSNDKQFILDILKNY